MVIVAAVQMKIARRAVEANLHRASELIAQARAEGAQLVCLPEMWTTGFDWTWNAEAAPDQHATASRFQELARNHGVWLNGSILLPDDQGRPANTSLLISPEGTIACAYRKAHLFGLFQEQKHITAGNALGHAETPIGHVGLAICYDLRFPELFRSYALQGVDIQLLPSAFPHPRQEHWRILLRARAIENQTFVIATNQVGTEEFGPDDTATYFGTSCIIDPWGRVLAEAVESEDQVIVAKLDLDEVARVRARMPVLSDRRPDLYRL